MDLENDALAEIVERVFGADVAIVATGPGFDGAAAWAGGVRLIVLAATPRYDRQHFALAHLLGHLLDGIGPVHQECDVFDVSRAQEPAERVANAFAAELLMPCARLEAALCGADGTERTLAALALDLKVPPGVLARRVSDLSLAGDQVL